MHLKCDHRGISRIRSYDVWDADIPAEFDGFRIAFVTDTHYASRFTERTLYSLGRVLKEIDADALMLGGDYQEGCDYVEPLFRTMMDGRPRYGAYAVMGNNDYERCTSLIAETMASNGIKLLEGDTASIYKNGCRIIVAGAKNTFRRKETEPSPTLRLSDADYVILLTHTPDYVEDVDVSNADLALAGHTHGGQVTLFGLWAPVNPSHYGRKFLKGLAYNSQGQPIIVSTGIGTSRKNIRAFAPSEVVVITLHPVP